MSELVWIHRFNANELGLGDRGAFCLVPVEARTIFFPGIDFNVNPDIDEMVTLYFQGMNIYSDVNYKKPASKTEHRLSLSGFRKFIGDENSDKPIIPGAIGCFYKKGSNLHFSVAKIGTVYDQLLKDFPSRGRDNNLVTEAVFENEKRSDILIDSPNLSSVVQLAKPFLLLAGISGTGKTRFVREQAREFDSGLNNFCLVPVRPDWHDPSDLLGYVTRLSGTPQYVPTEVIKFITRAWQVVAPNASAGSCGELDILAVPYWLCLDEMNLAPVEQYFADYLSVLESRKFDEAGYECDALLDKDMLQLLAKTDTELRFNLGVVDEGLWSYFLANGIQLPPNLIVAGTVNMDETTHGFSRKVIDRAVTLDFGEFFPNDYSDYFEPTSQPVVFTWSALTHGSKNSLAGTVDVDGAMSIVFLDVVNTVLKRTPFELAYRALNELMLQVACLRPSNELELQAVWDDFLMTKVLPRIDGDEDKLRSVTGSGEGSLLDDLTTTLEDSLHLIWNNKRKDYFRLKTDGSDGIKIDCRSKAKLEWMKDRLAVNTFTSYWP
jgi:hypothetical protein